MGSPPTRARGTVLVAGLLFEIIAALFLTAGFFAPGWICETKKQIGLWYSVDYTEENSAGVVKYENSPGKEWVLFAFNRTAFGCCVLFLFFSGVRCLRPQSGFIPASVQQVFVDTQHQRDY